MLSHEQTMELIEKAQNGDNDATTILIEENTPLVKSILKRYTGKHVEYDDLLQISSIGLLKAIKHFSMDYNVKFSTYAVPMILGEIKRYMRDDGYIKVSRSLKSLSNKIQHYIDDKEKQGISPNINDIATAFEIDSTEVVFALESTRLPISIYETTTDKDGKETELIDRLPTDEDKKIVDDLILKDIIQNLPQREKKILYLRYYRDMTQSEIALKLNISQVQVSRIENKTIELLKEQYANNS